MDQLICASLSHTHYWYEVGMLKVLCGSENDGKKGQGGVGLAVRTSITRAARPPKFISDRLLEVVTLELRGRAKAVTFVVA